jgi:hypothetical protein
MSVATILAQSTGNGVFVFGGAFFLFILAIVILASVFWIWMLIDVLASNLPTVEKLLWFCVVFFLHLLGAIIYFIVARPGRARPVHT